MSFALAIHGGAGALPRPLPIEREQAFRDALAVALAAGTRVLRAGDSALDAVTAAVVTLEDDPLFNAGRGAVLTLNGTTELDAAIMDGATLRAGAVAQLEHIKNPVRLARHLLEHSAHVFMAGTGAEAMAREAGLEAVAAHYFVTAQRSQQLAALKRRTQAAERAGDGDEPLGTVGAVARDRAGNLAAATSTGGTTGKRAGRIGDSPLIGAGTYADNETCAVSTTGHGEWFIRTVQAYDIAARLRYGGMTLDAAVDAAMARLGTLGADGGMIAVDRDGRICTRHNTPAMFRASIREDESAQIGIY
jgi:beta-aspartyl-peptidase (threonine type)